MNLPPPWDEYASRDASNCLTMEAWAAEVMKESAAPPATNLARMADRVLPEPDAPVSRLQMLHAAASSSLLLHLPRSGLLPDGCDAASICTHSDHSTCSVLLQAAFVHVVDRTSNSI